MVISYCYILAYAYYLLYIQSWGKVIDLPRDDLL